MARIRKPDSPARRKSRRLRTTRIERACVTQAKAIATHDPAGEEIQFFIDAAYEWPPDK